jgi:hypothetical protein
MSFLKLSTSVGLERASALCRILVERIFKKTWRGGNLHVSAVISSKRPLGGVEEEG